MKKGNLFDGLKGLKKPEEKSSIEFSSNPINELKASCSSWMSTLIALKDNFGLYLKYMQPEKMLNIGDYLYKESLLIATPRIKGITNKELTEILLCQDKYKKLDTAYGYLGLYFTALLNNSCMEEITVDDSFSNLSFLGYKLSKGRLIIKADSEHFTGAYATGGLIENYKAIYHSSIDAWGGSFARFAYGGRHINYGHATTIGDGAKGGIFENYFDGAFLTIGNFAQDAMLFNYALAQDFANYAMNCFCYNSGTITSNFAKCAKSGFFINNGSTFYFADGAFDGIFFNNSLAERFGSDTKGGIYLNCGRTNSMGKSAQAGLFISKSNSRQLKMLKYARKNAVKINWLDLLFNPQLNWLIKQTRAEINHIDRVKDLLARIKDNCTERYIW